MNAPLPDDTASSEKTSGNPRSLKNFLVKLPVETFKFLEETLGQPVPEEKVKEISQQHERTYLKIPERDILDMLETEKDPREVVEESFELLDDEGINVVIGIKAGELTKKKANAFIERALPAIARQILNMSLGHPETHSNYSPLISEIAFIHSLIQKKRLTQRNPKEEIKFSEEEIDQLAENLTNSLIDVRGLISKLENKINTGQYL